MIDPVQSTPPSEEELFYLRWGEETIKKNIENAHGVLTQFLTLNTALMGGGIAFMKPESVSAAWLGVSLSLFFSGLVFSFLGVLPHETKVNPVSPTQIKEHKELALLKKRRLMWGCAAATGGGLAVLAIGVIIT